MDSAVEFVVILKLEYPKKTPCPWSPTYQGLPNLRISLKVSKALSKSGRV